MDHKAGLEELKKPFPDDVLGAVIVAENVREDGTHWIFIKASLSADAIEERLDSVDPNWSWEVLSLTPVAIPSRKRRRDGREEVETKGFYAHGRLTVLGIPRDGVGFDADPRAAVTMAFKNAAGRFGIGRYLSLSNRYARNVEVPNEKVYAQLRSGKITWSRAMSLLGLRTASSPTPAPPPTPLPEPPNLPGEEEVVPFEPARPAAPEQPWHRGLRQVLKAKGIPEEEALRVARSLGIAKDRVEDLTVQETNQLLAALRGR